MIVDLQKRSTVVCFMNLMVQPVFMVITLKGNIFNGHDFNWADSLMTVCSTSQFKIF